MCEIADNLCDRDAETMDCGEKCGRNTLRAISGEKQVKRRKRVKREGTKVQGLNRT